jgi:hypothetical protein
MSVSPVASVSSVSPAGASSTPQRKALREAVNQVVGQMLYAPMFKMASESPFKGGFGHGGRGEDIFRAQLDMELGRRAATRVSGSLSDALYERLVKHVR